MLKIPENVSLVLNRLSQNGYEAYIVGGCVRDLLLGLVPYDFDITTSAKPQEVISLFEKTVPTGIKHGTVTVLIKNEPIEVTTFRRESGYTDSRHPESVEFVSDLAQDLSRRDFTVNALAYNEKAGLVDLFGGVSDLEGRTLKAVGDPELRFKEDALRILRLFRFASQLEFCIEQNTLNFALRLKKGLESISRERIFSELQKTVNGKNPKALEPLISTGGLAFLGITELPEFKSQNPDMRFFEFFKSTEILKELKASGKQTIFMKKMHTLSHLPLETKEDIKNALFLTDVRTVKAYLENNDGLLNEILNNNEPYLISQLEISGKDLTCLGLRDKEIGQTLELLRREVVNDPQKNKKEILIMLTKQYSAP